MITKDTSIRIPERQKAPLHILPRSPVPRSWPEGAVEPLTADPAMRRAIQDARRVARCDLPVLVTGESGVGKEVLVQYLHSISLRRDGPLVAENCSAIAETLAESLLFGHVRGAFTGADRDRPGLFAQADGGTLFLDEVGDMPLAMQARLLRVLEEKRVRPVGSQPSVPVDVRIVCATHRDLFALVQEGRFRADLYYRLAGATVRIPALRERPDDVVLLAEHFLRELNASNGTTRRFAESLLTRMRAHAWPGNVRELRHRVAALFHLSTSEWIDGDLAPERAAPQASRSAPACLVTRVAPLRDIEREALRLALDAAGGDRAEAARLLGVSRSTVYIRIRDFGL
ncbi:MAG TPA: sigma 54-interacting transcriptional regulator [Planctomycetota bacterium]|nr:sigma 54-interacting transcriptional regulator [Planctomycetota bacterium]